jgi:Tfp pilus assembly protein PilN
MKTTINLITESIKPKTHWYNFERITKSLTLAVLLMSLGLIGLYAKQVHANKTKHHLTLTLTELKNQSQALKQNHEKNQLSLQTTQQIQRLQEKTEYYQTVNLALNQNIQIDQFEVSPILTALATVKFRNLWLTEINIEQNHLKLKGITVKPELLPLWIKELKQLSIFSQALFFNIQMNATDQGHKNTSFEVEVSQFATAKDIAND